MPSCGPLCGGFGRCRGSLVLAYYAGMSTAEISDQLGVNRSTIKTRIRDGLRTLRAELHEHPTAGAA